MDINTWIEMYKIAEQYYEINGNLLVPSHYTTINNVYLGSWIRTQRKHYKSRMLSKEKIELLEQIGMVWEPLEAQWYENYREAEKYYKENGDLLIPYNHITDKGIKLGAWIRNQRNCYKNNNLSNNRIKLLERIGMSWNTLESQWREKYELAILYYEKNGDLLIPFDYITDRGIKLGAWINTQRSLYKTSKLSKEKIDLLNKIEMVWEPFHFQWGECYKLAKKYYEENRNLLIPINYTSKDGINLGQWIAKQRAYNKSKKLSQEKVKLLERIGMEWDPYESQWYESYRQAEMYYRKNGDLLIPLTYTTDDKCNLGSWIGGQRRKYKKHKLTKEKIELLEQIGMVWDTYEARWYECYSLLVDYNETHGNSLVPLRYTSENGIKLGYWVSQQRTNYKEKKLSQEKIELLEKAEMVWDPAGEAWKDNYLLAKQYYEENKNLSIASTCVYKGVSLGSWIETQRRNYIDNRLSDDQIDMLNQIGMEWVYTNNPDYVWEKNYNTVLEFYSKYKHLYIPISYVTEDGVRIGVWLYDRKLEYERNELSEERKKKLDQLDKTWLESINTKSSFPEQAVLFYIKKVFPSATKLSTKEISEIDIYIPELNTGIEYDGPSHRKRLNDDKKKSETCKRSGISLIRIRDSELPILNDDSYKIVLKDDTFDALNDGITKLLILLGVNENKISVDVKRDYIEIADNYIKLIDLDWYMMYEKLKEYHKEYGNINVPIYYKTPDGMLLGHWLSNIRSSYKNPNMGNLRLNSNKIRLLEELGIDWSPIESQWESMYLLAKQYYDEEGHLLIPNKYVTSEGIRLGRWLGTQRFNYKEGILSKEKIDLLEKIGIIWSVPDYDWKMKYDLAVKYYHDNGDLLVPNVYKTSDGVALGAWIGQQRKYYRDKKLSGDKIDLLNQIGMIWSLSNYEWMRMYDVAKTYYFEKGDLAVPKDYKTKENDYLGAWIERQRKMYKNGELSEKEIIQLTKIGMEWTKIDYKWMKMYEVATSYYAENGNVLVPSRYITNDGINLGTWIKNQRKRYREGRMTDMEEELLNKIGMVWVLRDT